MVPIRVGLIGCGNIARTHANRYCQLPDLFRVVACCDVRRELAEKIGVQVGGAQVFTDYREMLRSVEIDAVDITLPHYLHSEAVIAAAEAKKHILVEKPMAMDLREAKAMVDAAEEAGVILMVAQNQRYHPAHQTVKRLLDEGFLGRLLYARASIDQYLSALRPPNNWLFKRSLAGGGAVISIGVHKIDLLRWFIGEVVAVYAVERQTGINAGMDCEDVSVALLEFENGAVADLASLYAAVTSPWGELIVLYGTEGVAHNIGGWKFARRGEKEFCPLEVPQGDSYRNELEHFGQCLQMGQEPLTSGRDNMKTMGVIEAIYRSAREATRVSVKEILGEIGEGAGG